MNDGKKRRSGAELSAHKRFAKSRSRWIYPAFQNNNFVFCGDWGISPTRLHVCINASIAFRFLATVRSPSEAVIFKAKAAKPGQVFICKFYSRRIDNVHCTLYNFNYTLCKL